MKLILKGLILMNLFGADFIESFRQMLHDLLKKVIEDILMEVDEDEKFLLSRKEISDAIGCDPDTFDTSFRYLPGFPYHKKGRTEAWNKKEVFEYLHKNKLIK